MYDAVKVIHHSPQGALICLFVCLFFQESETAECGYCDVCDSCVLCAVSFISPLMASREPYLEVCTLEVTLIERLLLTIITLSVKTYALHTQK